MKKIFFSLLAIAALASCAKTEAVFTQDNSEIKIAPVTAMNTKAQTGAVKDANYPTNENFKVYAYWKNEAAGSTFNTDATVYLSDVKFVNKGKYWGGETTQYWPKNGSLRFAAYSPADVTMTHNLATDVYTLADFTYVDNFAASYDILVAPTSQSYTAQTAADKVSVVFEHALSWLSFNVKSTETAKGAFTVHSVTVDNVAVQGTMVADMAAGTKNWEVKGTKVDMTAYAGNATVYVDEKSLDQKDNLVLPQATTTVTINFTQNSVGSAPALPNQTLTIPLTLDQNTPWEAGKKYTYTIVFDLDEILINPSVEDWEVVEVPEIDATPAVVATAEELQAAINVGKSVRLADDIQLTESIVVANSLQVKSGEPAPVEVVIDLNGKDIIAPSTDAIVVEKGAKLTINGNGKVSAATDDESSANAVWVKHGYVTINGGNYYVGADKAERNECIYVGAKEYDNKAAEKHSELEINGGRFEAKVEDGQYWVLNLRDTYHKAGSKIIVNGGQYVNFDPANNKSEGVGTNFLGKGVGSYELTPGVWTVVALTEEVTVANINALTSVGQHGGVARLVADLDLTAKELNLAEGKSLVLDLNQHTLTIKSTDHETDQAIDPIKNYGVMVIKNGNITAEEYEQTRRCVYNYGTMTLEDVNFIQKYNLRGAAINNAGEMTIEYAKVNAEYFAFWNEANGVITVKDGEYVSSTTAPEEPQYCVMLKGNSKFNVLRGTFVGGHGVICSEANSVADLNDGTYTCTGTNSYDWVLYANGENEGGTVYYTANCVLNNNGKNNGICGNVILK